MTPAELAVRLARSFDLLETPNASHRRQQTLRATMDWSFELLAPSSRAIFTALSVCKGGFGLEAAEALGAAQGRAGNEVARAVADLWDQSLLRTEGSMPGKARYRMLALVNEYASSRLDSAGDRSAVARAHAAYFVDLATRVTRRPYGPDEAEQVATLDVEFDNLRTACVWCVAEGNWDLGMKLLDSLVPELVLRERIEVGRWAAETLGALGDEDHPVQSVASAIAANVAMVEGRLDDAQTLSYLSLESEGRLGSPVQWLSRNTLALVLLRTSSSPGRT